MAWFRAVAHVGTGPGWHNPAGAYEVGGVASHAILSGDWTDPGFIHWGCWLLLQFDHTYTSTTVRWYVSWIYGAVKAGLKLQYTVNGELVSQEVPAFPTLQEITFTERDVSAMGIRYGSAYTFPRNEIEPRIHGPYSAVLVKARTFTADAVIAAAPPGRTYFFLG